MAADCCQASASAVTSSLAWYLDFLLSAGFTSAAMCPLVDRTNRVLPPSSWLLR